MQARMIAVGTLRPHPSALAARPVTTTRHFRAPHVVPTRRTSVRRICRATAVDAAETERAQQDPLYTALSKQEAWLVSTQEKVPVTSLWNATEKCVLVFARSMGCVFCQVTPERFLSSLTGLSLARSMLDS